MELATLQYTFQTYLLNNNQAIFQDIAAINATVDPLNIYKSAYFIRMEKALSTHYPALKTLLGTQTFSELCQSYIHAHPSPYFSLRRFGDQFFSFLRIPYLAELAKFEWLMGLVFDSANNTPLTVTEMSLLPPENWRTLQFTLQASVYRIDCHWNTVKTWETLMKQKTKITVAKIYALKKPQQWILWRQGQSSRYAKLTSESAWMIDAMMQRLSFGEICEGLSLRKNKKNAGTRAALLLKSFLSAELISKN